MKRTPVILIAMLVALAACDSGTTTTDDALTFGAPMITGDPLPLFGEPEQPNAPAPGIAGQNFAGNDVTFVPGEEPTVLVFLAHWCNHCQAELPRLVSWLEENPQEDVAIYAIATSINAGQPNFPPSAWMEREGWSHEVIVDNEESMIAQSYGLSAFPFWAVVGADGNLVGRAEGGVGEDGFAALFAAAQNG